MKDALSMKETLQNVQKHTLTLWGSLDTNRKIMVLVVASGMIAVFIALALWSGRPEYAPLFTNLATQDAADIVEKLKESRVPYDITDGGKTIRVPSKDVYEVRLALASEGLPQGGNIGFEIFDRSAFGATDFTQRINYKRGLQGELVRTIMGLAEVEQARVHIAMPEPRLYTENEEPPTASVVMKLKRGASLSRGQVKGIVHLVASSVEGLSPASVTVLDDHGNILWAGESEADGASSVGLSASQLEIKRTLESELEKSIESMIERVAGPGKCVVRVSAELDFDRLERDSEIYEPASKNLGIVRSEQKTEETQEGTGLPGGLGPAGTDSNTPSYKLSSQGGNSRYVRTETTTTYEMTKRVERLIKAPGGIKKLSVAVVVDDSLPAGRVEVIKQTVAAAAGIDPARGDQILVQGMEFAGVGEFEEAGPKESNKPGRVGGYAIPTKVIGPGLIGLFLLIFSIFFVSALRRRQPAEAPAVPFSPQGLLEALAAQEPETPPLTLEARKRAQVREQLAKLIKSDPHNVVRLLQGWLSE